MKTNILKKKLPKILFWVAVTIGIISLVSIYAQGSRCNPWPWSDLMKDIHDFTFSIFLYFIFPLILLLFILSFFINIEKKFLKWTLFLAILGLFISSPLNYTGKCPDDVRKAILMEFRIGELMFFEEHQRYATHEELKSSNRYKDPETGKLFILILTEDKQNFEIRAKLDKGGWFVCDKDGCEEKKEITEESRGSKEEIYDESKEFQAENTLEPFVKDIDPDKIVEVNGMKFVVNEIVIVMKEGTKHSDVLEIIEPVRGIITGFIPEAQIYKIEVPANMPEELDNFINIIEDQENPLILHIIKNLIGSR